MIRDCSKLFKILFLILISLVLYSCKPGCVEPYEFDSETVIFPAYPADEGVYGKYDNNVGGQLANWTNTGLRSNGDPIILRITGSWSAWEQIKNRDELNTSPICTICYKKDNVSNCLCSLDQDSQREPLRLDKTKNLDDGSINCATNFTQQDDPELCTCTKQHGLTSDLDTYMVALDYQKKDETVINPDDQNVCRYTGGVGLYLGMFGQDGVTFPYRAYHLFTQEEVCDIVRNHEGKCVDDKGGDVTQYIYRSPDNKMFIKDDKSGNNGSDIDGTDDEYHRAGELIKGIVYDRYYNDNVGEYKVTFLSGTLSSKSKGILELIVGTVEDMVIGKIGPSGKRENGMLEFLYKSIVQDSSFILMVQAILILYVTFFGVGILMGTVQLSQKELMSRILKVALVMFFTSSTSWVWYNQIVVGFFKDGMDSIIALFMDLVDLNIDDTSLIKVAQLDRANGNTSQATRFSYIDYVLKKLLSTAVHQKIWSLALSSIFGFLYIPLIYALILYFIYVVMTAALIYITAVLKLVVALGLGPLFIIASLFGKTEASFKRWIAFLAARSLEMIVLFLVIYSFLILIDKGFTDLLWLRSCQESLNLGVFIFDIFRIDPFSAGANRTLIDWMSMIVGLGALMFLLKTLIDKIPYLTTDLVSISGTGAVAQNASSLANAVMGDLVGAAKKFATNTVPTGLRYMNEAGKMVARATGLSGRWSKFKSGFSVRNPISIGRDMKIDSLIKKVTADGKAKGKTGIDLNKHIRTETMRAVASEGQRDKNQFSFLGVDGDAVANRLNKKLIKEPLKKFLKAKAKELRGGKEGFYGKEMRGKLREAAGDWAEKNLHVGRAGIQGHLDNMKNLMKKESRLDVGKAAKRFAGDTKGQNEYLDHLNRLNSQSKFDRSKRNILSRADDKVGTGISNKWNKVKSLFGVRAVYSPSLAKKKFLDKTMKARRKENYMADKKEYYKKPGRDSKDMSWMNPTKTKGQRFERLDSAGKKKAAAQLHDERRSQRSGETLKGKVSSEIDQINKSYKNDLERYGYRKSKDGKAPIHGVDIPSRRDLQKKAKNKLDALTNRLSQVKTEGNLKGMDYSLNSMKGLMKKNKEQLKQNKKRIKELKKNKKRIENQLKVGKESKDKKAEATINRDINLIRQHNLDIQSETQKRLDIKAENKILKKSQKELIRDGRDLDFAGNEEELRAMQDYINTSKNKIDNGEVLDKEIDDLRAIEEAKDEVAVKGADKDKEKEDIEKMLQDAKDKGEQEKKDEADKAKQKAQEEEAAAAQKAADNMKDSAAAGRIVKLESDIADNKSKLQGLQMKLRAESDPKKKALIQKRISDTQNTIASMQSDVTSLQPDVNPLNN